MSDALQELNERLKLYTDRQALLLHITRRIAQGGSLGAMLPDITNATLRGSQAGGIRIVLDTTVVPLTYASGPLAGQMLVVAQRPHAADTLGGASGH